MARKAEAARPVTMTGASPALERYIITAAVKVIPMGHCIKAGDHYDDSSYRWTQQ